MSVILYGHRLLLNTYQLFCIVPDSPELWLRLGQNIVENEIMEGDDVYFDCEVSANPAIQNIVWKHDVSSSYYLLQYSIFNS